MFLMMVSASFKVLANKKQFPDMQMDIIGQEAKGKDKRVAKKSKGKDLGGMKRDNSKISASIERIQEFVNDDGKFNAFNHILVLNGIVFSPPEAPDLPHEVDASKDIRETTKAARTQDEVPIILRFGEMSINDKEGDAFLPPVEISALKWRLVSSAFIPSTRSSEPSFTRTYQLVLADYALGNSLSTHEYISGMGDQPSLNTLLRDQSLHVGEASNTEGAFSITSKG
jgi:hypothetical protein